ncbi:MAG TPA: SMP-30/gluconolactonase/LRE family protein [Oligoflexus sp.]|uniref:SMP-30/gluconolactonase/LRE family protein n=1 Tax=Oligoflexus sp. TaxID=1971216 RepID=UPI002D2CAD17|nr:SMP-30/gluconolactonase/LRE family protein [Oligoflexus sp.]HYX31510.1 SMP-30/gluconolactonase/LRE family protein [Oligoflexus sp.]
MEYADSKTTATKSDDVIQQPVVDPAEPGMNPLCEAESSPEMFSSLGEPVEVPLPFPFEFTEGPVWLEHEQALLISAWNFRDPTNGQGPPTSILKYAQGTWSVWSEKGVHGSNGLAIDSNQNIVAALHDRQEISRITPDGTRQVVGSSYQGKAFNSPNDLTVAKDGTIYFTDPAYQRDGREGQGLITGVYAISPNGAINPVDLSLTRPNGIVLSPDEKLLYVGGSDGKIFRYRMEINGEIKADGVLATPGKGIDGMSVDCAGNIYATVPSEKSVHVYSPAGILLTTIAGFKYNPTNVAFGGTNKNTMFVTTAGHLFQVEMKIPGFPY